MPDPASPDPDPDPETARLLAEQTAEAMFSRDAASKLIDLKLASVRPGYSRLTMLVRPDMVNGHHICHGGYLFTLADSAFAYACNSYNRNTVASACHIDFLTPAREGELLEAECEERSLAGRTGVYDVTSDWNPVLGPAPGLAGLLLAFGFSGHGFKLSPAVGRLLAQAALGLPTDVPLAPYALQRFGEGRLLTGRYGAGAVS